MCRWDHKAIGVSSAVGFPRHLQALHMSLGFSCCSLSTTASSFCPAPVSNTSSSRTPNATGVSCPPPAGSVIPVAPCPHFLPWGHLLQSSYVYFSGDRLTGPTPQAPATAGWLPHHRLMLWLKLSVSGYSGTDAVAFSQATCVLCPAMQQSNNQFDTLLWSLADLVRLLEILKEEISGF